MSVFLPAHGIHSNPPDVPPLSHKRWKRLKRTPGSKSVGASGSTALCIELPLGVDGCGTTSGLVDGGGGSDLLGVGS